MDLDRSLAHAALRAHPHESARVLERLGPEAAVPMLANAASPTAAEVLRLGAPHFAVAVLASLPRAEASRILEASPVESAAAFLRRLSEGERTALLASQPDGRARMLQSLLRYPPGSAASFMDPRVLALPEDVSADDALKRMRRDPDNILFQLYVLDREDSLLGVATLRKILAARSTETLGALMHSPVQSVPASASEGSVLQHPGWQVASSLPVVDEKGIFLGAIRYRTFRQLERKGHLVDPGVGAPTVQAIGELFSTAVGGVIEAMAASLGSGPPSRSGGDRRG